MEATKDQLKLKDNIDNLVMSVGNLVDCGTLIPSTPELKAQIEEQTALFNDIYKRVQLYLPNTDSSYLQKYEKSAEFFYPLLLRSMILSNHIYRELKYEGLWNDVGQWSVRIKGNLPDMTENESKIYRIVSQLSFPETFKTNEVNSILKEKGNSMARATLQRSLKKLEVKGLIKSTTKGYWERL
jgi:hypothetical protein